MFNILLMALVTGQFSQMFHSFFKKGEHIRLVGANSEGKITFMNIVTGKLMPDEGKIEWSKNVHAGYLDR